MQRVGQKEFHEVDEVVMGHVFDIHNTLGRFCGERAYQEELAYRCRAGAFEVHREVLLRAVHNDFAKPYYLDMLIAPGIIYELKAADKLNRNHEKQLIHYLLLASVNHGKLVNFRPGSVQSRFVSTRLQLEDRLKVSVVDHAWTGDDAASQKLREVLLALVADWGTFLDANLYREALLYFLGGAEKGAQPVRIQVDGRIIGTQTMCILDSETAWHLSAVRNHLTSYQTHLHRLLRHTDLKRIQWINLDQRTISLTTIE